MNLVISSTVAGSDLFFNYMFYKMAYFSYSLILAIYTGLNIFDPKLQSQTQVLYGFSIFW
jgi:hypothetical protein